MIVTDNSKALANALARINELEAENTELRKLIDSTSGLYIPSNAPKTSQDRIRQLEGELADAQAEIERLGQFKAAAVQQIELLKNHYSNRRKYLEGIISRHRKELAQR